MAIPVSARTRFESRVDRSGEHHLWLGTRSARGVGQARVGGKLITATRLAWEIAHGPLPETARVSRCPEEPSCVRLEHLSVVGAEAHDAEAGSRQRAARGGGSKRATGPGVWQLTVTVGSDDRGSPKRSYRNVRGTEKEATRALAAFVAEVENSDVVVVAAPKAKAMTVDELVVWSDGPPPAPRLEDERDILATVQNYCHAFNHGDEAGYLDLFDPDARLQIFDTKTGEAGRPIVGHAWLARTIANHTSAPERWHQHHIANSLITIDGDQATATSYFFLLFAKDTPDVVAFGRYRDQMTQATMVVGASWSERSTSTRRGSSRSTAKLRRRVRCEGPSRWC